VSSRLDEIAERNRRALGGMRDRRPWLSYVTDEIRDAFDSSIPREQRRPKQLAMLFVVLVIAGIVAAYLLWPRGEPGGTVRTRGGATFELASLWEHKRVVVVFYPGSGGEPNATLQDLDAHRASFDADVIAVSSQPPEHANALHENLKLGFEIYVDPTFEVMRDWGVRFGAGGATVWAIFIVEPGGTISFKHVGEPLPSWDEVAARTRGGGPR